VSKLLAQIKMSVSDMHAAKFYLVLAIFCLVFFTAYPYIGSIEIEGLNFYETIQYQLNTFPDIMIFSFLLPLLVGFLAFLILLALARGLLIFSFRAIIFLIVMNLTIVIVGYLVMDSFFWIFVSLFPFVGSLASVSKQIKESDSL